MNLILNEKLFRRDYSAGITGDGAGALLDSIKRGCLSWNAGQACADGWPACRARAVLNGADGFSNVKEVRDDYMLNPEESLFSCFPEELQRLIAAKKVVSNLNNDNGRENCVTTYDKLWLFSKSEGYAWLRSISPFAEVINRHIYGGGHETGSGYYNVFALTPGFCLP